MSDSPKKTFGKYEAISHLGSGAMGVVWRAQDPVLGRTVAIKTISAALASDSDNKERFLREARAAAQLNHPNIITVFDFGQADNELYMAMELLEGKDLKELITAGQLTLEQKLNIMEQTADGLAYAHGRDVIHRDLKPGNIHVQPNGQVKILDFGLARLGSSDLTKTGVVMGTPNYMSPEQVMGERADARSDVFSVGGVFYELLTNRKPFDAESVHATLYQVVHREPVPPRQWDPKLPEGLVQIVEICMSKQVAGRYKDALALHSAIRAFRYGEEPEVVEEFEQLGPEVPAGPVSADETSVSPGPASSSSSALSKPQPFRSYGRTGTSSISPSSTHMTGGIARPGSGQLGSAGDLSDPQASMIPAVAAAPKNLLPLIAAGFGALVLVLVLGFWKLTQKPAEVPKDSRLDALATSLVESQLNLARRALADKNYKAAVDQAEGVLKVEALNPEAMGIRDQARSALAEIETWSGVARAAVARGATSQATVALQEVMARDPNNPIVAELSTELNASFSARASEARVEMEKSRSQAEATPGAAGDVAFAEGEELAAAAGRSFELQEFTTAAQTFLQARDAYDRARRGTGRSTSRGGSPAGLPGSTSAAAPQTIPGDRSSVAASTGSAPTAGPASAALNPAAPPPVVEEVPSQQSTSPVGTRAGGAVEFQTGQTSIDGPAPLEFEGKFEFEIQPKSMRVGTPFRIRVFLKNEGTKEAKIDRFTVKVSRNQQSSNQDAKIVEDNVKVGQRVMIAVVPTENSGKSLFLPPGTTEWKMEVDATSRKGERFRSTFTLKQP